MNRQKEDERQKITKRAGRGMTKAERRWNLKHHTDVVHTSRGTERRLKVGHKWPYPADRSGFVTKSLPPPVLYGWGSRPVSSRPWW